MESYDVIIAGGSFAGLAVAAQIRDARVLLIEPNPIGEVQTSACGTLLAVLEATSTQESLLQIHESFFFHTTHQSIEIPLPYPFCTFDYHIFCQRLLAQSKVQVLQARVTGHQGQRVMTTEGTYEGRFLVDATGWRAALATGGTTQHKARRGLSFGLETTLDIGGEGLHFWYDPQRLLSKGVTWLFPIGGRARLGIGSYVGETRLQEQLARWLEEDFNRQPEGLHGGFFPYRKRPARRGNVLCVGDSAGQCLPVTGEGIRTALYFGVHAGRLIQRALEGSINQATVFDSYQQFVDRHAIVYDLLLVTQKLLTNAPIQAVELLARQLDARALFPRLFNLYRRAFEPNRMQLSPTPTRSFLQPEAVR